MSEKPKGIGMVKRYPDTGEKEKRILASTIDPPVLQMRLQTSNIGRPSTQGARVQNDRRKITTPVFHEIPSRRESIKIEASFQNDIVDDKDPRKYDVLMDEHALHMFMVRNGEIVDTTPEFESFKRVYKLMWSDILPYLQEIQIYCRVTKMKLLNVNGSELIRLVRRKAPPTAVNLVKCLAFFDPETQRDWIIEDMLFFNAARKVQSIIRMHLARIKMRRLRIVIRKIKYIQSWVRVFLQKKNRKISILENNAERYLLFEDLQAKLQDDWAYIKEAGRVEIHFNCLAATELQKLAISKYEQRENLQIGRIFRALEKNVDIIYVSSTPLPDAVIKYYYKVLELVGVPFPHKKVSFIVPEGIEDMPPYLSLASKLLYSNRAIKKIRDIVAGRFCVIVGGIPTPDDIKLSLLLRYPILSGHPMKNATAEGLSVSKEVVLN